MSASAGSGKTHQLVNFYLEIVLGQNNSDRKFKEIVAMTFTNKASFEMKERILETLDAIANNSGNRTKIEDTIHYLTERLSITKEILEQRAGIVLTEILHSYEDFQVSTIDKFNLRLIRSFARDLDLPQEFEIILNEREILEKVVDAILVKIGKNSNSELTSLVENYTKKNLDEGTAWNFRSQLIDFSSILSTEKYHEIVKKLIALPITESALHDARKQQKVIFNNFRDSCNKMVAFFENEQIDLNKIPNKSKTYNPILALKNLEDWSIKKGTSLFTPNFMDGLSTGFNGTFSIELTNLLQDLSDTFEIQYPEYIKLKYFSDTFYNLALLQFVAKEMESMRMDEQFIRISEFNKLVSHLVQDQEAPYIYEKLGMRLNHFLLDEFQDTSRLQWLNLVPLVHESISKGNKNLIVGDPKQSIYRFNNGLAEQFVALPGIYNPEKNPHIELKSEIFKEASHVIELDSNFRSAKEIITFNNSFFQNIKRFIPKHSLEFYKSITQKTIKKNEGFVQFISSPIKAIDINVNLEIKKIIEKCVLDGFKPGDICILSERNQEGNEIAQFLTKEGFKVVSTDSLLVHNNLKIRLCVSYFKRRERPSNIQEAKKFAELYLRVMYPNSATLYMDLFEDKQSNGKINRVFKEDDFLMKYFGGYDNFFMNYDNLYDLIQKLIGLLGWNEVEDAYLHHFADTCFNFQIGKKVDIASFLEYYESKKEKLAVQLPETDDAIQIMTIHKSKGLQFPVVIIPRLDFSISNSRSNFLIEDGNRVYYRQLNSDSPIERIREFTEIEKEQILMDKFNLLYVALTRPEYRLYGFNIFKTKNLGTTFDEILGEIEPELKLETIKKLTIGKETKVSIEHLQKDEFYKPENTTDRLWYPELVIKNQVYNEAQNFGNGFHELVSKCKDVSEIESTAQLLVFEGTLDPNLQDIIKEAVHTLFKHVKYRQWLKEGIAVKNEQWIITPDGKLHRPDQIIETPECIIIIDFKTGLVHQNHKKQILGYKEILEQMQSKEVLAFLYYSQNDSLLAC